MVQTLQPALTQRERPRSATWPPVAVVDAAATVVAAAVTLLLITDLHWGPRAPLALLFAVFVPGWTGLRLFRTPLNLLSVIGSVALSVTALILIGEGTVLLGGWHWFPVLLALSLGCALLGAWSLTRRSASAAVADGAAADRETSGAPGWVPACCTLSAFVGTVLVIVGLDRTDLNGIGLLGVVDTLSPLYSIGVAVGLVGFLIGCWRSTRWAWCNVAALLVALYALPGILEPHPRFSVAWLHVGFADHIAEHGTLLTNLDGRFSWAGFFAGGALLQRLSGTGSLLWLVRYAPVFYTGASIILVALLARRTRATTTQTAVAAALFCCLNWIGQDYFAPQATGFLLYLTLVVVVLHVFPANPIDNMHPRVMRMLRPEPDNHPGVLTASAPAASRWFALLACYVVVAAVVVAHQLTPAFIVTSTALLAICNSTRLRMLPLATAVMFVVWLSFGADAYWIGHLDQLTGSVGHLSSLVNKNVSSRTESTTVQRSIVVTGRLVLALLSWGLAALSLVSQWRKRRTPVALACLFLAPFPVLFLQPYGGEMALRVCYFTLPAACILIARLIVPTYRFTVARLVAIGAIIGVLIPAFVTARYGNEKFEMFTDSDVQLMDRLYSMAPADSIVFVASMQTLQYTERVADVRFRDLPAGTPAEATARLVERQPSGRTVYVMLSDSQQAYGEVAVGRAANWMQQLAAELMATGHYVIRERIGDTYLLELVRA